KKQISGRVRVGGIVELSSAKFARHESGIEPTTPSLHARIRHRRSGGDDPVLPPFCQDLSGWENTECRAPRGRGGPRLAWENTECRRPRRPGANRQTIRFSSMPQKILLTARIPFSGECAKVPRHKGYGGPAVGRRRKVPFSARQNLNRSVPEPLRLWSDPIRFPLGVSRLRWCNECGRLPSASV